jgi:hypothetical protein
MGKKKQRAAKSLTKEEWKVRLGKFWTHITTIWDYSKYSPPVLVFDNPKVHNLTKAELLELHIGTKSVLRPPAYSGDFMQPIEHAHGTICAEFKKRRFQRGWKEYDLAVDGQLMRQCFNSMITAKSVQLDCERVLRLVKHMVQTGNGGYAPPSMC